MCLMYFISQYLIKEFNIYLVDGEFCAFGKLQAMPHPKLKQTLKYIF